MRQLLPVLRKVVDAEKDVRVAVVAAKALKKVVLAESLVVAPDAEKDAKLIPTSNHGLPVTLHDAPKRDPIAPIA